MALPHLSHFSWSLWFMHRAIPTPPFYFASQILRQYVCGMAKVFGAKKLFTFKRYLRRHSQLASAIYWGASVSFRKVLASFVGNSITSVPPKTRLRGRTQRHIKDLSSERCNAIIKFIDNARISDKPKQTRANNKCFSLSPLSKKSFIAQVQLVGSSPISHFVAPRNTGKIHGIGTPEAVASISYSDTYRWPTFCHIAL